MATRAKRQHQWTHIGTFVPPDQHAALRELAAERDLN